VPSRTALRLDPQPGADTAGQLCPKVRIDELSSGLASIITSSCEDPRQLIAASLDALLDMLRLDFAYATFVDPETGTLSVAARALDTREPAVIRQRIGPAIEVGMSEQRQAPRVAMRCPGGDAQVVRLRLGMRDEIGVMLLGSARNAFPTRRESVLLSVVAGQLAIGLRGACLLRDQKCKTLELDRKVARQARKLQVASEERQRALERLHELQDRTRSGGDGLREHATLTRGGLAHWQMQRATKLMTANLQEHVPLSQLAAQCGLSVRHFARAFRQSTGLPPHRWLLNHRVEHARELLRDPMMSLVEIALACGFADQSHFTRTFTALAGLGPGLWRRMESWRLPIGEAGTDRTVVLDPVTP
jgi:AraC-like DNA-binding protein